AEALERVARREGWEVDVVAPVPLHRRKRRERGFNQAEVLAREVARRLRLPARDLLVWVRDTPPQGAATTLSRRRNVEGAFAARAGGGSLRGARPPPRVAAPRGGGGVDRRRRDDLRRHALRVRARAAPERRRARLRPRRGARRDRRAAPSGGAPGGGRWTMRG